MENPSDDFNSPMAMAAAIVDINSIADIEKDESSIENKPCTSDSQLILDSIMSTKHDPSYPASFWHDRKRNNKELESVEYLVIPTPTESEALEIEQQGTRQPRTVKGVSMSDTTVTSGENSTPIFPADYTTNADIMTPNKPSMRAVKAKKASSKGEIMPKALPPYVRRNTDKESRSQRIYTCSSPYSKTSTHLGVIQEEDEDNDN